MRSQLAYATRVIEPETAADVSLQIAMACSTPYFFQYVNDHTFSEMLRLPNRCFIEASRRTSSRKALAWTQQKNADFTLAMTSYMANQPHISHIIARAVNERFGLNRQHFSNIHTCLQEAIANSLIHGNLGINEKCETLDDFDAFYQLINQQLADPFFRLMRVYVMVWNYGGSLKIGITHEGAGRISDQHIIECHPALQQKSGRGLYLIQTLAEQVWCNDHGKSLYFTFSL